MKNFGKLTFTFLLVVAGAFIAVWTYSAFFEKPQVVTIKEEQAVRYASIAADGEVTLPDLTYAAEKSVHAVVHIATQSVRDGGWTSGNPFLDELFGMRRQQEPQLSKGFGSGVILSDDGFIVTNNHVIDGAQNIKVILNDKREFVAELIGTDPSTDIALLKIEAEDLPFLVFGDSDALKLGEWVLAVGNPFNLTSTVTAGIISARARNLGINRSNQMAIESFIQTDAAVNPGNSGGALVNQRGDLIGINAVIATQTGSYTGYSFAVPATIAQKVVNDLKEFGEVQRALIGVNITDINAELAEELDLEEVEGVYVAGVPDRGAAYEAGIKEEDVIISVDGDKVKTMAELQEKVSQYRPGDDVKVVVIRGGKEKLFDVTLRNKYGDTQIVRDNIEVLGAQFQEIKTKEKHNLEIRNGIKITDLDKGVLKEAGIKEGFIIVFVNKKRIYGVNDFRREIEDAEGRILVEGIYPNGELAYYVFGVN